MMYKSNAALIEKRERATGAKREIKKKQKLKFCNFHESIIRSLFKKKKKKNNRIGFPCARVKIGSSAHREICKNRNGMTENRTCVV